MQLWTTFLVWAACLLSLAVSLPAEEVPGQIYSLQLLFGKTDRGVVWHLWQGPRGIPINNICYDNADTRFSLVASFSGLDGDLSKPPFPNGVKTFPGSVRSTKSNKLDCFYFNDGKNDPGHLQCGDDAHYKINLTKDPGYGQRLMSCNKGDVHEDWARGYFAEFD